MVIYVDNLSARKYFGEVMNETNGGANHIRSFTIIAFDFLKQIQ